MKKAILYLEKGKYFEGVSFGSTGTTVGEVIFNTSMTGYQEIITDPSYHGQIVVMTYPHIGNVGVNREDMESRKPFLAGFVVREGCRIPSSWRAEKSLPDFLEEWKIVGIEKVDTREITREIRDNGAQMGVISTEIFDLKELKNLLENSPRIEGRDIVKNVTTERPYIWREGSWKYGEGYRERKRFEFRVAAIDCGIKHNIMRLMVDLGCEVYVFPYNVDYREILEISPHGLFISNGPGDPQPLEKTVETIRHLLGKIPAFGICLGHQLIGLALGGKIKKLKFGHHGGNHPVKDLSTGKIEITAQNHNFVIDIKSLEGKDVKITHINLYDHTLEGISSSRYRFFSIQYHPEASPGPHDARYLFKRFVELMREVKDA